MTSHRGRVALLLFALCVATAGVAGPVLAASGEGSGGLGAETFAASDVDPDTIEMAVSLSTDGTAGWTVEYRVELADGNETAAFEDLQAEIRANSSAYVDAFRERLARTARTAENATGRAMAIENVSVETSMESIQGYGTVTYRFRWANFSTTSGDAIQAGDALAGFFLEADSRLTVSWPADLEPTTVDPEPDQRRDGSAIWTGPVDFGSGGPQVVVGPAGGPPLALIGVAALVGLLLAGGAWYVLGNDVLGGDGDGDADDADEAASVPDDELLSNEERVLKLLDERGGRVKQQEVAAAFDWTDAKTSQVVSSLREDEEIDVFRLGRENVLVLPEESEL